MEMRPSRVLARLRSGAVASCFKLNLESPRAAEIAAMAGFDCVWTDCEHTANDWSDIAGQILAAKSQGVDTLVRVSRGGYSDYIRPLALDAAGIMVPHIMSLADAQQVVKMTRFYPLGRRPVDSGNADGAYCNIEFLDYLRQANEQRFVVVQIEDPEPLAELDAIAAVPGIDMLFFGPADFSHAIGAPGVWDNPVLLDARRAVARACIEHGKFAGTVGSAGNFDQLVSEGYRFISIGADVVGLGQYCKASLLPFIKQATDHRPGASVGSVYAQDASAKVKL